MQNNKRTVKKRKHEKYLRSPLINAMEYTGNALKGEGHLNSKKMSQSFSDLTPYTIASPDIRRLESHTSISLSFILFLLFGSSSDLGSKTSCMIPAIR